MEKNGIIKSVGIAKPYDTQNGRIYYRTLTMDNGDSGSIGTKEENPSWLKEGENLDYLFEVGEKGNRIKKVAKKPAYGGVGGKASEPMELKVASYSLSYAKDAWVGGKIEGKDMFTLADKMYDWISGKINK